MVWCVGVGVCQNPSSTHQHETLPIITIEWVVELQVDDMIWYVMETALNLQSNPITWVVCWYPTFRGWVMCVFEFLRHIGSKRVGIKYRVSLNHIYSIELVCGQCVLSEPCRSDMLPTTIHNHNPSHTHFGNHASQTHIIFKPLFSSIWPRSTWPDAWKHHISHHDYHMHILKVLEIRVLDKL